MSEILAEFYLSGGSANADPTISLGGVESSIGLGTSSAVYTGGTPAGVTLVNASIPYSLTGELTVDTVSYSPDVYLRWDVPAYVSGVNDFIIVPSGSNTDFIIPSAKDNDILLRATVNTALIAAGTNSYTVTATKVDVPLFNDLLELDSIEGAVHYRCLYLRNTSGVAKTASVWFEQYQPSPEIIELGVTSLTSGSVEASIGNEDTEPAGILSWGSYDSSVNSLSLTLNAGESIGIWVRRTLTTFNTGSKTTTNVTILAEIT